MTKTKRSSPPDVFLIQITVEERDMLLAHVNPPDGLDHLVPRTPRAPGAGHQVPGSVAGDCHLTSAEAVKLVVSNQKR